MVSEHAAQADITGDEAIDARPRIETAGSGELLVVRCSGDWLTATIARIDGELGDLERQGDVRALTLDLSQVGRIDTAGAWVLQRFMIAMAASGAQTRVEGASAAAQTLLGAVEEAAREPEPASKTRHWTTVALLDAVGKGVFRLGADFMLGMHILGATVRGAQLKLGRRHAVNPAAIAAQIERMGIGAIPVILLMSSIVGGIVAQQGAFQLRYFGAEIFTVDLVGILVLRELGVLMTAIMIAGRSGSAITAEIGSMKMREEIDALTVIGLNPIGVLVFPRLVALVIALPCLTIIANFAAIGGAMLVADYYSGVSFEAFIDRLRSAIDLSTIFAGLIKAPFMALIIGVIAASEGMKVEGSAESLGRRVTSSVVKSIFVVIVVDGLFAMFYAAINF